MYLVDPREIPSLAALPMTIGQSAAVLLGWYVGAVLLHLEKQVADWNMEINRPQELYDQTRLLGYNISNYYMLYGNTRPFQKLSHALDRLQSRISKLDKTVKKGLKNEGFNV